MTAAEPTTQRAKPIREDLPGIRAIVAVSSAKGGVGKSTVTVNLALALCAMGKQVGILDADILGPSVAGMLGIRAESAPVPGSDGKIEPLTGHGVKAVSMAMFSGDDQPMMLRGPMVGKYLNLFLAGVSWGDLDILLIDMPPGTGDIQLNIAQSFPLSGAIVVTTPQSVSTGIAKRGIRMFEAVQTPILGVVENMRGFSCPSCGETHDLFGSGGGEALAADVGVPFLAAMPLDREVVAGGDAGVPLVARHPGKGGSAAYSTLAARVVEALADVEAALPPFKWRWSDDAGAPGWNETAIRPDGSPAMPVGLRREDESTLAILWQDGAVQPIDVRALRLACGCALCRDEMTGRPLLDPSSVAASIRPVELRSIGRYAIGLTWSDGHTSGIHPYAAIRGNQGLACPVGDDCVPDEPAAPARQRDAEAVLEAVRTVLEGRFNRTVARHGGRIRPVGFTDGRLTVEMEGRCQGCAASQLTLRAGLAAQLRETVPEVREIIDVTDHQRGEDPYLPAGD